MPPPTGPRSPGYRFKDGKLMIFSETEVMLIRGWNEPSAVKKTADSWEPFAPEFRLVAPYRRSTKPTSKKAEKTSSLPEPASQLAFDLFDQLPASRKPQIPAPPSLAEQRKRAFDSFRFSLPKEVAKVLEGFRSRQWPLLTLLAFDLRFLDLATTNPALAFAMGGWFAEHPKMLLGKVLGQMKQRELLKLLKLPDSAAMVKLFRKIPPESIDPRLWKGLLSALRQPDGVTSKWLAHIPSINLGVIDLIVQPHTRRALTPTLLEEVASDPKEKYRAGIAALLRDTLAMKSEIEDDRSIPAVSSVAMLREIHESVSVEFQKLESLRNNLGHLPRPPMPGIKDRIVPLRTITELLAEGRIQKNCVASYAGRVIAGECFIYRVLHPNRATLSVSLQSDGNWEISELKASCNRSVDAGTRAFVNEWLALYRIGA